MENKANLFKKVCSLVITAALLFQQTGFAQVSGSIDLSGYLGGLKNSSVKDIYRPAHLRYFSYDNLTDNFKLLLEKGDFVGADLSVRPFNGEANGHNNGTAQRPSPTDDKLTQEASKLLKYFLTGVSLPDDMFWVNLRPDSQDQVIDNWLEKTDVGKIMLEADLQLKKDTAMLTSPETTLGRKYWDKLYKKAAELYGYDNVTIPTLTRPWIVPGEIIVRETIDEGRGMKDEGRKTNPSAYIYKAVLKVMLEEDYLKNVGADLVSARNQDTNKLYEFKDPRAKELNKYSTELIRELIIPKLTKEVNSSKRYAALRQVYYSLILSRWFKARFGSQKTPTKASGQAEDRKKSGYVKLIDSKNLTNLTSQEAWSKDTYFKQYQKSFSEGEYNIKEPVSTPTGQVIRSYFSGGIMIGAEIPANSFVAPKRMSSAVLNRPDTALIAGNAQDGVSSGIDMGNRANSAVNRILYVSRVDNSNSNAALTREFKVTEDIQDKFDAAVISLEGMDIHSVKAIITAIRKEKGDIPVVVYHPYNAYSIFDNEVARILGADFLVILTSTNAEYRLGEIIKEVLAGEDISLKGYNSFDLRDKKQNMDINMMNLNTVDFDTAKTLIIRSLIGADKVSTPKVTQGVLEYIYLKRNDENLRKFIEELLQGVWSLIERNQNTKGIGKYEQFVTGLTPKFTGILTTGSHALLHYQNSVGKYVTGKWNDVDVRGYLINSIIDQANELYEEEAAVNAVQSSPIDTGGIDFGGGAMDIRYEATGIFKGMDLKLPDLTLAELNSINIDSEIQRVKKMVSSGISPSGDWIMKLVCACKQKGKLGYYSPDLLLCVVDTCELGEMNGDESSEDFKKALAVVDLLS